MSELLNNQLMRGCVDTFMGIPVIESRILEEKKPRIELSNKVDVSPEFRAKCNAWYLEIFGEEAVVYMIDGKMITHPNNVQKLRAQAAKAVFPHPNDTTPRGEKTMSLFQCEECGCIENTALACQGMKGYPEKFFDWAGFEDRKGKLLCSACGPTKYADGNDTEYGKWHGVFSRKYLPLGMFKTSRVGNLEHKETGDTEYEKYLLKPNQP